MARPKKSTLEEVQEGESPSIELNIIEAHTPEVKPEEPTNKPTNIIKKKKKKLIIT